MQDENYQSHMWMIIHSTFTDWQKWIKWYSILFINPNHPEPHHVHFVRSLHVIGDNVNVKNHICLTGIMSDNEMYFNTNEFSTNYRQNYEWSGEIT